MSQTQMENFSRANWQHLWLLYGFIMYFENLKLDLLFWTLEKTPAVLYHRLAKT